MVLRVDVRNTFNLVSWSTIFQELQFLFNSPILIFPIYLMILCMPIPTVFFSGFLTWGSHNHFVKIRYMIERPIGRNIVFFGSLLCFLPCTTTHPICVFISLVGDTHIIGFTLDVVLVFFMITTRVFNIETFYVINEMCSLVSIGVGALYITFS